MARLLKWIGLTLGALILVIIALFLIVPHVVDFNTYKPRIERMVAERTGRPFSIGGPIAFSLFPWAGFSLSDVQLGNVRGFEEEHFVSIDHFEVRAKLIPLIFRDFRVKRFIVRGPRIVLEQGESGRGNWENLLTSRREEVDEEKPTAAKGAPLPMRNLMVDEFAVTSGELVWIDHRKNTRLSLTGINLVLDGISLENPIGLEFSAVLDGQPLEVEGNVGPLGRPPGAGKIPFLINVRALDDLVAELRGYVRDLGGKPQFSIAVGVQPFSPRKLAQAMGFDPSKRAGDVDTFTEMSLKTTIAGTTRAFALEHGILKLDDSSLTFNLHVKQVKNPVLSFEATLDSIDLDRYLFPLGEVREKAEMAIRPGQRRERKPSYRPLLKLAMDGTIRIGRLRVRGADISDISLKINAKNGTVCVAPLFMNVYGGSLSGGVTLNLRDDNSPIKTWFPLREVVSRLIPVGREVGISSLELEIHGASIGLVSILGHLGHFLPPAILDWKPMGEMEFDFLVATTTGDDSRGTRLNLGVRIRNGAFARTDAVKRGDRIEGGIRISVNVPRHQGQPIAFQGELGLEAGVILLDSFSFDLESDPFRLRLRGDYDPSRRRVSSLSGHFRMPTLGEGTITATLENPPDPQGEVRLALGPISNRRAFDLFVKEAFGRGSPVLRDISINGETLITASITGTRRSYSIQGLVEMEGVDLVMPTRRLRANGIRIRLPFSLAFPRDGKAPSPIGLDILSKGLIHVDRIKWRTYEWRNLAVPVGFVQNTVSVGQVKVPMWGGDVVLTGARMQNPLEKTREVTVALRLDRLDLSDVATAISPSFVRYVPPGSLESNFAEIRVSEKGVLTRGDVIVHTLGGRVEISSLRGSVPFSGSPKISMDMMVEDIILEEASLGPFLPTAILNWRLSGAMAFDFRLEMGAARLPHAKRAHARAQLRGGAFSSPDGTTLGEGIQGEIRVKLGIPSGQQRPTSFEGNLSLEAGEILLGSFYVDLRQDPLGLRAVGAYDAKRRGLPCLRVQFQAPTLGEGSLRAAVESLDDSRGEVTLQLGPISNRRAFELFVKEPFGQSSPVLKDMSINGQTRITASIRGSRARYGIQALLETSAEDLSVPAHKMKARGVKIQLPVSLRYPKANGPTSLTALNHSAKGFIEAEWIRWEAQEWRNVSLPVTLRENILFLPRNIRLPLWGGKAVVEGAKIHDPYGKSPEVTLGLRLEGLDLSQISKAFAPFLLPGSLESDFSEIKVSAECLTTSGSLTIKALGGRITVGTIRGKAPFSRLREVSMDVLLRDMDLGEVSRLFQFGEMSGAIEGWVRGLTFSFGQPKEFELEIRSVKKRGIRQYVNAEAVNDLSILSSGTPFSFRRGVLQMIKYFPYAKLGIYCKLENDVFTLRGTINENGVEYLIKRGPFRGIDVINRNPENRIRWKQMLTRLKAVGRDMGVPKGSNHE